MKYALFFDFHTQKCIMDIGVNFDAAHFVKEVRGCGTDFLTFHARCNQGFAYYDTAIGLRHPSLKYDLFGKLAEECRNAGLPLMAYFNGGLSDEEAIQHRDWTAVRPSGRVYPEDPVSPFLRPMCVNSPGYRTNLIAMMNEVAEKYPVEGFFVDCLGHCVVTCVCPVCLEKMRERAIDFMDVAQLAEFTKDSIVSLCGEIVSELLKIKPDLKFFFNGPAMECMKELDSYYDFECLPTAGWGYECLPPAAHYLRTLCPGKPVMNMTGRFNDWGDFGSIRPKESLLFDLYYGLAHGMRPNIGGHFHPRGDLDLPVFRRIGEVYSVLKKYDEWFTCAEPLADAALISPPDIQKNEIRSAVRILEMLKIQFDIVSEFSEVDLTRYRLLVLPEHFAAPEKFARKIRGACGNGSRLFACGIEAARQFRDILKITSEPKPLNYDPVYFSSELPGLAGMPLALYAPSCSVSASGKTIAEIVAPCVSRGWNGIRSFTYTPPDKQAGLPLMNENENSIYIAGDFFTGYAKYNADHLRILAEYAIGRLLPDPLLKTDLPRYVRTVVTRQPGHRIVHLISYIPEHRLNSNVVDEAIPVLEGSLALRSDHMKIRKVLLAPDGKDIPFHEKDGYIRIQTPNFKGTLCLVFEESI